MPENTTITPIVETTVSTNTVVSPAIAAVMESTHTGAVDVISLFHADQINPVRHYLRVANGVIRGILGEPTNPEELSKLIALKRDFREQEAANDAQFQKAA